MVTWLWKWEVTLPTYPHSTWVIGHFFQSLLVYKRAQCWTWKGEKKDRKRGTKLLQKSIEDTKKKERVQAIHNSVTIQGKKWFIHLSILLYTFLLQAKKKEKQKSYYIEAWKVLEEEIKSSQKWWWLCYIHKESSRKDLSVVNVQMGFRKNPTALSAMNTLWVFIGTLWHSEKTLRVFLSTKNKKWGAMSQPTFSTAEFSNLQIILVANWRRRR